MAYVARLGAWVTVVLAQFLPMFPQAGAFGNEAYDETWCLWPWWFSKGVQGPPRVKLWIVWGHVLLKQILVGRTQSFARTTRGCFN